MSALGISDTDCLFGIATEVERARRHVVQARAIAGSLQHDYRGDPRDRAIIALLTHDGRMAELWRDLLAQLEVADERLGEVARDLGRVLNDTPVVGDEPGLDDVEAESASRPSFPSQPIYQPRSMNMANLRAWANSTTTPAAKPALQFKGLTGEHIFVPLGGSAAYGFVVNVGTFVIFDWGRFWEGEVCFKPFDDKRMVLRGTALPPYSGDTGYDGGFKVDVMVQGHGLCQLLTTSGGLCTALERLYDDFVVTPAAQTGKLLVYRIEESRSYTPKRGAELAYAPVYTSMRWIDRDAGRFGKRLIEPPKPSSSEFTTAPALESEKVFEAAASTGELVVMEKKPTPKASGKAGGFTDLDDEVPF
jgi:hypothetical protein